MDNNNPGDQNPTTPPQDPMGGGMGNPTPGGDAGQAPVIPPADQGSTDEPTSVPAQDNPDADAPTQDQGNPSMGQ